MGSACPSAPEEILPRLLLLPLLLSIAACERNEHADIDWQPEVTILAPEDHDNFEPGEPLSFCALVTDEDAVEDLIITLQSDVDDLLWSSGDSFEACGRGNIGLELELSEADHHLNLSATDSNGHTGTAQVTVRAAWNNAPTCWIFVNPDSIALGESTRIDAEVEDDETVAHDLLVRIESDLEGVIYEHTPGTAGEVDIDWTPAEIGEHNIVLEVTDPRGAAGDCSTTLEVTSGDDIDWDGDGWTVDEGDCDDSDPSTHPEAEEEVDGVDNDCNGSVDEGTIAYDDDGDGYCESSPCVNTSLTESDCDDNDASVHPGAEEVVDGVDNDCDGSVDEETTAYDDDGDGYCEGPPCVNTSLTEPDCDDNDASVHPGADEVVDGVDNDCDGSVDEGS
jgi:hypothetical protein